VKYLDLANSSRISSTIGIGNMFFIVKEFNFL
jgi:hypothetical protein